MTEYIKSKFRDANIENLLLFTGALVSILWSTYFSTVSITIPYQIELREGAAQVATGLLLSGENPFTLEHQPLALNIYGIGYHLVVLPFAAVFGNTLLVHRSVTFAAIVLSAAIVFATVYKARREPVHAFASSAFVMIALIGNAGNGAFSSATGTFLFLAAVLIPFLRNFDHPSLIFSAIFALGAFYTKPYFVLSFGVVASFVFLFVSKKKGLEYALFFLALFVISFFVVRSLFPLYFFNTILVNLSMSWLSYEHLLYQLSVLFFSFSPILFLCALLAVMAYRSAAPEQLKTGGLKFLNISGWQTPLIPVDFNYFLYILICVLAAFVLVLGQHGGNYMNYAYQLVVPVFFAWFFQAFHFQQNLRTFAVLIVLINLFMWQGALLPLSMLEQKNSAEWARFFSYVRSSSNILNSQVDASEIVHLGLSPIDTGQTIVYYQVKPFSNSLLSSTSYEAILADGNKYVRFIDQSIQKQEFDLVVSVKEKGVFYHIKRLENYYYLVDEIHLSMPQAGQRWTVLIWKPKPK